MSHTLKANSIKIKYSDGTQTSTNIIVENSTSEALQQIENKKNEVLNSIPSDYTELSNKVNTISDNIATNMLDGTVKTYNKAMREWLISNGAKTLTPVELTALVNRWYALTRDSWDGFVTFAQPSVSTSSDGTKGGDNAGMTCVPSTDKVAGQDDYAALPLFAVTTCNWILDDTGNPLITAIKGVHASYEQDNPEKYVGVIQMTGYTYQYEDSTSYTIGYTANKNANHEGLRPLPEAIALDGTVREFVLHGKYTSKIVNGKMTCCAGLIPTAYSVSHNSLITQAAQNGAMYSGESIVDWSFLVLMTLIKYGSMTQDGRIQGCCNYNYQYYAKVAETNVNRVIISKSEAANLIVGSSVLVGAYAGSTDRWNSGCYNITGQSGAIITSIEDVTIDDTVYSAVYIDCDNFDTSANGNATTGTTIISTYHWKSGTNDTVLGNDGSIVSASNGKFPAMIQGIEYAVGGYEVMADVILDIKDGYYTPYIACQKKYQATSVTANMKASELKSAQPTSDSWNYIRKLSYDGEIFFGTDTTGGSSSTFTRDAFCKAGVNVATATKEWLAFGGLAGGSGFAGLACLRGDGSLGTATWYILSRLSPNGNRGELAA